MCWLTLRDTRWLRMSSSDIEKNQEILEPQGAQGDARDIFKGTGGPRNELLKSHKVYIDCREDIGPRQWIRQAAWA